MNGERLSFLEATLRLTLEPSQKSRGAGPGNFWREDTGALQSKGEDSSVLRDASQSLTQSRAAPMVHQKLEEELVEACNPGGLNQEPHNSAKSEPKGVEPGF